MDIIPHGMALSRAAERVERAVRASIEGDVGSLPMFLDALQQLLALVPRPGALAIATCLQHYFLAHERLGIPVPAAFRAYRDAVHLDRADGLDDAWGLVEAELAADGGERLRQAAHSGAREVGRREDG